MTDHLWNDDDVERGAAAMSRHYAAAPFLTSDLTTTQAVLDAVLPAIRARWEQGAKCHCEACWLRDHERRKAEEVQP